jgi:Fe-S-cluster containining protein
MATPLAAKLADRLQQAGSEEEIHAAYAQALAAFDELNQDAIVASGARLDCRAGCSFCCSLRVDVYAHEIFLIARFIRTHFSEAEQQALAVRLATHAAQVLRLTPFEHATRNIPCVLLRDGRCSVYAARPMACRRHHSKDVKVCEYTFAHPLDLKTPAAHEAAVIRTLNEAMADVAQVYAALALDTTLYELGTALDEALMEEASWPDWLNHMEAFARASVTPAS